MWPKYVTVVTAASPTYTQHRLVASTPRILEPRRLHTEPRSKLWTVLTNPLRNFLSTDCTYEFSETESQSIHIPDTSGQPSSLLHTHTCPPNLLIVQGFLCLVSHSRVTCPGTPFRVHAACPTPRVSPRQYLICLHVSREEVES